MVVVQVPYGNALQRGGQDPYGVQSHHGSSAAGRETRAHGLTRPGHPSGLGASPQGDAHTGSAAFWRCKIVGFGVQSSARTAVGCAVLSLPADQVSLLPPSPAWLIHPKSLGEARSFPPPICCS